jgi:hypothetical protein
MKIRKGGRLIGIAVHLDLVSLSAACLERNQDLYAALEVAPPGERHLPIMSPPDDVVRVYP